MTEYSQNGWPVLDSGSPLLRLWQVPGTKRHYVLRDGSAGFLLTYYASWYNDNIEAISTGQWDEWGWAVRNVRGSATVISNHSSGTAIDTNSVKHPLGVSGTLAYYIKRASGMRYLAQFLVRRFLRKRLHNLLRWGGDYHGRKDEMHVEVNASLGACESLARVLIETKRGKAILAANKGAEKVIMS